MHHALGDDEALLGIEGDRAVLQIDEELAGNDVEELVIGVMLMPVILALNDSETNDRFVDAAQSLVVPGEFAVSDERPDVDHLERVVQDVEAGFVGKRGCGHELLHRYSQAIMADVRLQRQPRREAPRVSPKSAVAGGAGLCGILMPKSLLIGTNAPPNSRLPQPHEDW